MRDRTRKEFGSCSISGLVPGARLGTPKLLEQSRATRPSAVADAVKQGKLWLISGQASILVEEIPAGLLTDDARLHLPPQPIPAADSTPSNLPEVWSAETKTALAIAVALSKKAGTKLPWATVRHALDGAI